MTGRLTKMITQSVRLALILVVCVGALARSRADLIFTLTPSLQAGAPGSSVTYSGTISYTGPDAQIFLNDLSVVFDGGAGAFLSPDTNVFFANVPGIFLNGDTWSSPIFGVDIASNAAPGVYTGTANIIGGSSQDYPTDPNSNLNLASQAFTLRVVATPEPGTIVLYLAGGTFIIYRARRRRQYA